MIRKVQYAPENLGPAPCVETTRDFLILINHCIWRQAYRSRWVLNRPLVASRACMYHNLCLSLVLLAMFHVVFLNEKCLLEYNKSMWNIARTIVFIKF